MARRKSMKEVPLKYGLLLFPQFEVLDVFGPLECLNTIVRMKDFPFAESLSLVVLARDLNPVSSGPIKADPQPFNVNIAQSIQPTHTLDNAPDDIDVLLVPGGFGTGPHTRSGYAPDVSAEINFIKGVFPKLKYLISKFSVPVFDPREVGWAGLTFTLQAVCTGATLAAQAGVLDDRAATTNKQAWDAITATGPKTYWIGHARWVRSADDRVWTTSGVSAGTDGFLAFLGYVYGDNESGIPYVDEVCASMEYTRAETPEDDPWAAVNKVTDVPPKSWPRDATVVMHGET